MAETSSSSSSTSCSSSCTSDDEEPRAAAWETHSGLTKDEFTRFTLYMNSNNPIDNRNRAVLMGHHEEGVKVRKLQPKSHAFF